MVLVVKNPPASAGDARDMGSIPGLGRPPVVGNGNPLQYSSLEKSYGYRSLVGYSLWGHKESETNEHTHTHQLLVCVLDSYFSSSLVLLILILTKIFF